MSQLLKALRHIDNQADRTSPGLAPITADDLARFGLHRTWEPPTSDIQACKHGASYDWPDAAQPSTADQLAPQEPAASVLQPIPDDVAGPPFAGETAAGEAPFSQDIDLFAESVAQEALADESELGDSGVPSEGTNDHPGHAALDDEVDAGDRFVDGLLAEPVCSNDDKPQPPQGSLAELERAYADIADAVMSRLPESGSAAFVFAGPAENAEHIETVFRLAEAISPRVDGKVLVVDANLRDTHVGERIGSHTDRGLLDLLDGLADWQDVICPRDSHAVDTLWLGNRKPTNISDRFPVGALARLLNQFRSRYPLVLVSASAIFRDPALSLAHLCDGVYLLVQLGRTPKRATKRSVQILDRSGARLLGCVVADI